MAYRDLIVLIPSHSLEDFPTELGEKEAASLLNAFAVVWHPALIAGARSIPSWHRADEPPQTLDGRLIVVPLVCDDWLPGGWIEQARSAGATVVAGYSQREDMLNAALAPLELEKSPDPHLTADFLSLGSCFLQVELLTRHMRHFSNIDEIRLQQRALAAADAVMADDAETARAHLLGCFEVLTEARERFYPVECYLIDLCLLIPSLADEHFIRTLSQKTPINVLATASDLKTIAEQKPETHSALREAWQRDTADVVGGEWRELPAPLIPLESLLRQIALGNHALRELFGKTPKTWARRRFGLSTLLPQILSRFGYHSALHVVLDDGIYPDAESSRIRWEGCDGTVIDAMSRIPLAADSAVSYLRFPVRMAESMDQDPVAAITFARWPEVSAPWFEDFRRSNRYSPVLGRFVTLDHFFQQTDMPGRLSTYDAGEYLSPFLLQSVARQEQDPLSRYVDAFRRRRAFDAADWCRASAAGLTGQPVSSAASEEVEKAIEGDGPDGGSGVNEVAEQALRDYSADSVRALRNVIMHGAGNRPGWLVVNPLSFTRRVAVELPGADHPPDMAGAVKAVQWGEEHKFAVVEVPGSGFAWIPADGRAAGTRDTKVRTAEPYVLRNEFFEVVINEETGGIGQIRPYDRRANYLSHQLAFRFPRERTVHSGPDDEEGVQTYYSEMRRSDIQITCTGPALGEMVITGDIVDQVKNERLAGFRQTIRVWRGRPVVELDIELEIDHLPEGDPWSNYFATRFAWNDSAASLTRSVLLGAQGIRGERFESPEYVEIASPTERTTILTHGLCFHRQTGPRMVDSLLVVAGETRRRFQFTISIDREYPLEAARDATVPIAVIPTENGPPQAGESGWFFHLDARNVQITRVLELVEVPSGDESSQRHASPGAAGFALRLIETEGRSRPVRLRLFRTPTTARQRDFQGRSVCDLAIEDDAVVLDLDAYEIADVELRFG